jgi:hypothetical protein
MNWIALNIPLGVVFFGFAVGLPLCITLKHPEADRSVALDPSVPGVVATGVERRAGVYTTSSVALASTESRMADV